MRCLIIVLTIFLAASNSWAQYFGEWDSNFGVPGVTGPYGDATGTYANQIIIGGEFYEVGGVPCQNVAAWDGSLWKSLGTGVNGRPCYFLEFQDDLYVVGTFTNAGGVSETQHIARWDGSSWHSVGGGLDDWAYELYVFEDELIVGGRFHSAGGVPVNNIAKWDGVNWEPMGIGFTEGNPVPSVFCFAEYQGSLIAGGRFSHSGDTVVNRISRWDGELWQPLGTGVEGTGTPGVLILRPFQGKLIVGGLFTSAGGQPSSCIAAWDGTNWIPFEQGVSVPNEVRVLFPYNDQLIVGGLFSGIDGVSDTPYLAIWNGMEWHPFGQGADNYVYDAIQWADDLVLVGNFSHVSGVTSERIAWWSDATVFCQIADVPDDQGGAIQIFWDSFLREGMTLPYSILSYDVQKLEDDWSILTTVLEDQSESYQATVATSNVFTIDQAESFEVFRVVANTTNPTEFYYSTIDSGYSIDNLAPPKPDATLIEGANYRYIGCADPSIPDLDQVCFFRNVFSGFVFFHRHLWFTSVVAASLPSFGSTGR